MQGFFLCSKNQNISDAFDDYEQGLTDLSALRLEHEGKLATYLDAKDAYNNSFTSGATTSEREKLEEARDNALKAKNDVESKIEKKELEVNLLKSQLETLLAAI